MIITEKFETISKNQLNDLEKKLGQPLPDDYKVFLLANNGGRPTPNIFRTSKNEYETDIQFFFGLTQGIYGIEDNLSVLASRLPEGQLPIATDSGGNYVLLKLSNENIYFFDHEIEESYFVTSNFTDFVNGLFDIGE